MFTLILDFLLATVAVVMLFTAHYGITRQSALVPLVVAAVDALFAGDVTLSLTPVLSALLIVLQVVVLLASALMWHQDRAQARAKQARRRMRREHQRNRAAFEEAADRRPARRVCA